MSIPVSNGAGDTISGLAFDGAGLVAVRPGGTSAGTASGVAYFSPNGVAWQYAGTINAAGGWSPGVVSPRGTAVAVGSADGYPAVWQGAPGGAWRLVSSPSLASSYPGLTALTSVTYGASGWLAVGVPGPVVLTSADGTTWTPAPVSGLGGGRGSITSLASSGSAVTAIGTSAAAQGHRVLLLPLSGG